jgi:hypothetical protein
MSIIIAISIGLALLIVFAVIGYAFRPRVGTHD